MKEKNLIENCIDRRGERKLYDHFMPAMSRLCLRYVGNSENAFDVLTSGFYKVFKKLKRFEYKGEGSLDAWIRKIMINECLMLLRKEKQQHLLVNIEHADEISIDSFFQVDSEYLYNAIKQLPTGCREVFNLFVIEGYSHKEIAVLIGITESASRSQLTYAKKKLRDFLNQNY